MPKYAAPSAFFVRIAAVGELEMDREMAGTIKDELWATEDRLYCNLFRDAASALAALPDALDEWAQERSDAQWGDEPGTAPVWTVAIADRTEQPGGLPDDAVWFRLLDEDGEQMDEGIASVCGISLNFR